MAYQQCINAIYRAAYYVMLLSYSLLQSCQPISDGQKRVLPATQVPSLQLLTLKQLVNQLLDGTESPPDTFLDQALKLISTCDDALCEQAYKLLNENIATPALITRAINTNHNYYSADHTGSLMSILDKDNGLLRFLDTSSGDYCLVLKAARIFNHQWHPKKKLCAILKKTRFVIFTDAGNPTIKREHGVKTSDPDYSRESIGLAWSTDGSLLIIHGTNQLEAFETNSYNIVLSKKFHNSACVKEAATYLVRTSKLLHACDQIPCYNTHTLEGLSKDCTLKASTRKSFLTIHNAHTNQEICTLEVGHDALLPQLSQDNKFAACLCRQSDSCGDQIVLVDCHSQQIVHKWNFGGSGNERIHFKWHATKPLLIVVDNRNYQVLLFSAYENESLWKMKTEQYIFAHLGHSIPAPSLVIIDQRDCHDSLICDLSVAAVLSGTSSHDKLVASICLTSGYRSYMQKVNNYVKLEHLITDPELADAVTNLLKKAHQRNVKRRKTKTIKPPEPRENGGGCTII